MGEPHAPHPRVCYCTNVHPGRTPGDILAQLDANNPTPHRETHDPDYRIGLWLSDAVAVMLEADDTAPERFANDLAERDIRVLTLNGFPQRDFHQPTVKREVYRPNWADPARLDYTLRLARILACLIPEGEQASISTLPIGWPSDKPDAGVAAELLVLCARELHWLAEHTGRQITLDLEPEPGCLLDTAGDVVAFWAGPLRRALTGEGSPAREALLAHLGVCHDVCHSAVMHEDQHAALRQYAQAGIPVHKVQISSAVAADLSTQRKTGSTQALRAFDEPRYLHQTTLRTPAGIVMFEDLGPALASAELQLADEARVHFHVPVFARTLGEQAPGLRTTQPDITDAVRAAQELHPGAIFELETYAWPVLPAPLQPGSLAQGIAAELDWFVRTFPELHT